mmetsp:Transcript_20090/g.29813  ORF Transcript_20090/g.29813 Transcript_20090/m.29813 type:complete len:631 (+) Transcript_20090:134-2026(+)|eukprot:CAMPEP_0194223768 /NCGR_PEP_ID=MMETSP0156-20130528/35884_1 /TAXON_ID=33649 /ORGANISM="Thalassionema nitzschioides, Strain L26-B" /LENGTH=630 /DNA_ID=CAMNT_0038955029 /DNA_START=54 /DNA_END=1946 /DNA_ORIENTATION=-
MSCFTAASPKDVVDLCDDDSNVATDQEEIIIISPRQNEKHRKKRLAFDIDKGEQNSFKKSKQNPEEVLLEKGSTNEIEVVKQVQVTSPYEEVLAVFPDVEEKYAKGLLAKYNYHVAMVVQLLAEESYPKEEKSKGKDTDGNNTNRRGGSNAGALIQHRNEHLKRTYKYDFMSESSFEPCQHYQQEAKTLLMQNFLVLTDSFLQKILTKCKYKYAISHDRLCRALEILEESSLLKTENSSDEALELDQFKQLHKTITTNKPIKQHQIKNLMKILSDDDAVQNKSSIVLKRSRKACKLQLKNEILLEEISYVQNRQHALRRRMEDYEKRVESRRRAEETKTTLECKCCYADVAIDEMVQCREAHLFCWTCVRKFAETQIFGMSSLGIDSKTKQQASELLCLSGCGAGLQGLQEALPENVWAKYNELQYQAAVSQVEMDDLCSCPKCGYQAAVPATEMIFRCPVGECGHESCRKCGEEPHIPLKCSEVEKKHETKGRLKVEEAITEAKIRKCPKCTKKIVKESGCNKMTCACGTNFCYICRAQINKEVGYTHFCQQAHCSHKSCGKCVLYTNAEQDDEQAMRDAGLRAAEEVRGNSLIGDSVDDTKEVNVNVDQILGRNPTTPKRKTNGARRR